MPEKYEEPVAVLCKRRPQKSQDARTDYVLRISGVITVPKAQGCVDLKVMARVRDALKRI